MSDPKDFIAGVGSDARKAPVRVAFITRRTSAQVKAFDEPKVQSFPEVLFRAAIAIEVLAIVLVLISLFFNAPLEGLADPSHTPNPAKAPWYFLGLQELLHYFPPVVAGVLVPTLVILALIVIPYFNINVEAAGLFTKDRDRRLKIFWIAAIVVCLLFAGFDLSKLRLHESLRDSESFQFFLVAILPTLITLGLMAMAAYTLPNATSHFRRALSVKPLSFWIMSWFLFELVVLTAVGTFFRGPGWSLIWPWSGAGGVQ
jgi:quinol-cytochrome oxidoreductase complex cytochrome b subunit